MFFADWLKGLQLGLTAWGAKSLVRTARRIAVRRSARRSARPVLARHIELLEFRTLLTANLSSVEGFLMPPYVSSWQSPFPPQITALGLQSASAPTGAGAANSGMATSNPVGMGTVVQDGKPFSGAVEFDYNGDGTADATAYAWNGTFSNNVALGNAGQGMGFGPVSVQVRAIDNTDPNGVSTSRWIPFKFDYNAPPAPQITSVALQTDTGTPGDNITSVPIITGTVTQDGQPFNGSVQLDYNGDGIVDSTSYAWEGMFTASLQYSSFGPGVSFGPVTLHVRPVDEFNPNNPVNGDWATFSFTYVAPPAPVVSNVGLQTDTGTPGDNITSIPVVTGSVTQDGQPFFGIVQLDYNGDGTPDATTYAWDGSFTVNTASSDFGPGVSFGAVTVRVRALDNSNPYIGLIGFPMSGQPLVGVSSPDPSKGNPLPITPPEVDPISSDWVSFSFTYVAPSAPQVTSVSLETDTGTPGDNITSKPIIAGTAVQDGQPFSGTVQLDLNGDGTVDATTYAWDGTFSINAVYGNFGPELAFGPVTVDVRAVDETGVPVSGDWVSFSFTYVAPTPPQITRFQLEHDTDTPGDNITTDPVVTGTITQDAVHFTGIVQIDLDGDGTPDATAWAYDGTFTFNPANAVWGLPIGVLGASGPPVNTGSTTGGSTTGSGPGSGVPVGSIIGSQVIGGSIPGGTPGSITSSVIGSMPIREPLPGPGLTPGPVTVLARPVDDSSATPLNGDWVSLSFTFVAPPPPHIDVFQLANDTGTPGDNITNDATVTGKVTQNGVPFTGSIQFDLHGDGGVDAWTWAYEGTFSYDLAGPRWPIAYANGTGQPAPGATTPLNSGATGPSQGGLGGNSPSGVAVGGLAPTYAWWIGQSAISPGPVTVHARAVDLTSGEPVYSDWVTLSFTYEAPPPSTGGLILPGNVMGLGGGVAGASGSPLHG